MAASETVRRASAAIRALMRARELNNTKRSGYILFCYRLVSKCLAFRPTIYFPVT